MLVFRSSFRRHLGLGEPSSSRLVSGDEVVEDWDEVVEDRGRSHCGRRTLQGQAKNRVAGIRTKLLDSNCKAMRQTKWACRMPQRVHEGKDKLLFVIVRRRATNLLKMRSGIIGKVPQYALP
jgi:hypothetical protein